MAPHSAYFHGCFGFMVKPGNIFFFYLKACEIVDRLLSKCQVSLRKIKKQLVLMLGRKPHFGVMLTLEESYFHIRDENK